MLKLLKKLFGVESTATPVSREYVSDYGSGMFNILTIDRTKVLKTFQEHESREMKAWLKQQRLRIVDRFETII